MRLLRGGFVVILLLPVTFIAAGCGGGGKGKPVKVNGLLTWEDGTAISGATVQFMSQTEGGRDAMGLTGADGAFDLTTTNSGDGALPGDYKIVVTKSTAMAVGGGGGPPADSNPNKVFSEMMAKSKGSVGKAVPLQKDLLPAIYGNVKTTTLQWKVERSGEKVPLMLKKS